MVHRPQTNEKPVHWIGSSKSDLLALPQDVVSDLGYALGLAQLGGKHPRAKPWKGEGAGVFEIVESFEGNAYRGIYTVRFEAVVYVLASEVNFNDIWAITGVPVSMFDEHDRDWHISGSGGVADGVGSLASQPRRRRPQRGRQVRAGRQRFPHGLEVARIHELGGHSEAL